MFSGGKSKRHPYLSEYIAQAVQQSPYTASEAMAFSGVIATGLVGVGSFFAVNAVSNWAVALAATVGAACPLFGWGWHKLSRWVTRPRSAEDVRRREVYDAVQIYHAMLQRRKLHKELDPVAGELLDACAYFWTRIHAILDGQYWVQDDLPAHWKAVRAQALSACESAMGEALLLGQNCIGKPSREKADDIKEAVSDLVDLNILDALQTLRTVTTGDWLTYAHKSPNLNAIFEPLREIAEKLKLLSAEVERMTQKAVQSEGEQNKLLSSSAIDLVLGELRAVRAAESELDEQQHLHGQG